MSHLSSPKTCVMWWLLIKLATCTKAINDHNNNNNLQMEHRNSMNFSVQCWHSLCEPVSSLGQEVNMNFMNEGVSCINSCLSESLCWFTFCRRRSALWGSWSPRSLPWRRRGSSCRPSARSRSSRGPSSSSRPRTCRMSWQATANRGYGSLPSASLLTCDAAPPALSNPLPLHHHWTCRERVIVVGYMPSARPCYT